jgi:hypothetical protein
MAEEPRIVESGPISLKITMESAIRTLFNDPEFLQKCIKEWLLKRLAEQAAAQNTEGEERNG